MSFMLRRHATSPEYPQHKNSFVAKVRLAECVTDVVDWVPSKKCGGAFKTKTALGHCQVTLQPWLGR